MALGYGFIFGLLAATALPRLMDLLGIPLNFVLPASCLAVMTGLLVGWRKPWLGWKSMNPVEKEQRPRWEKALWILLLGWLGLRLANLALEIFLLPLFPWDAWSTWMVRPQAWLESRQLLPFQDARAWMDDGTGRIHHIEAWRYPLTVSLIPLWMTLASGHWQENVVNMAWWCCGLALGLAFYGQARLLGATALQALIGVWFLLSLPLLDVHIALAGYADLWMATVFGLAAIAFMQWMRTRDHCQGIMALVLALCCPAIKQEGAVWLLLFLPALLAVWLPKRYFLGLLGLILTAGAGWLWLGGGELAIPGLGEFRLVYWNSGQALIENMWILDNFHLFGYLFVIVLIVAVYWLVTGRRQDLWVSTFFVLTLLFAFFGLFFLSGAGRWAEDFTSINRIMLHFIPALLFWIMTVFVPPPSPGGNDRQPVPRVEPSAGGEHPLV